MSALPTDPAPSSVELESNQPTAKSRAINGVGTQTKGSGIFLWEVKFSYTLLDFEQRNKLQAFVIAQGGRALEFDVQIPTYSENSGISNATSTPSSSHSKGEKTFTLTGIVGSISPMNLLRISGQKETYMVESVSPNIGGSQQVTVVPPLRRNITTATVFLTKDVPMNMSLDQDSFKVKSRGMSSSLGFSMTEEIL